MHPVRILTGKVRTGQRMNSKKSGINPFRWMTTYTDLVILLLTFFVLLISMSKVEKERKRTALASVSGTFSNRQDGQSATGASGGGQGGRQGNSASGNARGGQSVIGSEKGVNVTVGSAPVVAEDYDIERLRNVVLRNSLPTGVSIQKEEERIIISLASRLLFQPRSSQIEATRIRFLSDLREVLRGSPSRIELRGFADPTESMFDPDPLKTATMVAAKRALSILHFFSDGDGIPVERIVAHGFGSSPAPSGAEVKPHEQNRQVQIILDYRENLPFRLTRTARNPLLDFKGFFFKLPEDEGGK